MIGIVLDTNVVVSAHLNPEGFEATVFDLAISGEVRLFASEPIFNEYGLTLARPKFRGLDAGLVQESLAALREVAIVVEPNYALHVSADESDNRFLECAEMAGADFVVTGNKRHFPETWRKTRVVNAREFLESIVY